MGEPSEPQGQGKSRSQGKPRRKRNNATIIVLVVVVLSGLVALLLSIIIEQNYGRSFWTSALRALAEVTLISAVIGVINDRIMRESLLREFRGVTDHALGEFFDETRSFFNKTVNGSIKYGLTGLIDNAVFAEFFNRTKPGDHLHWMDTYSPGHQQWIEVVEKKAREGSRFKFLVLEPGCDFAKLRAEELGGRFTETGTQSGQTVFDEELTTFTNDLRRLARQIEAETGEARIEVRTYNSLLGAPMYIIERDGAPLQAWSSYYLGRATGMSFPHFEWKGNCDAPFLSNLAEYFDAKWAEAAPDPAAGT